MDRDQVKDILKIVVDFYGKRVIGDDPTAWVNNWFNILKDEDFDEINKNLVRYIKTNEYPPKPANLISDKEYGVVVPGVEATQRYLEELRNVKSSLSDKEVNDKLEQLRRAVNKNEVQHEY